MQVFSVRRSLSAVFILLALAASVALAIPYTSLAAGALYVGDDEIDTSSVSSGDGWSYDPSTTTLTLTSADVDGITCDGDLAIVLEGANVVTGTAQADPSQIVTAGISVSGDLSIRGDGSLVVKAGDATKAASAGVYVEGDLSVSADVTTVGSVSDVRSCGVFVEGDVVLDGAALTAAGADLSSPCDVLESYGLFAGGSVWASASSLALTGGSVRAEGVDAAGSSHGVLAASFAVDDSTLAISGSAVSAGDATSVGVGSYGDVAINGCGGFLEGSTASSSGDAAVSYGIETIGDVSLTWLDGSLVVEGRTKAVNAMGDVSVESDGAFVGGDARDSSYVATWEDVSVFLDGSVGYIRLPGFCVVTFDAQGGEIVGDYEVKLAGGVLNDLPVASRDGYAFSGWFTEPSGEGDSVSVGNRFVEDTAVYAYWISDGDGEPETADPVVDKPVTGDPDEPETVETDEEASDDDGSEVGEPEGEGSIIAEPDDGEGAPYGELAGEGGRAGSDSSTSDERAPSDVNGSSKAAPNVADDASSTSGQAIGSQSNGVETKPAPSRSSSVATKDEGSGNSVSESTANVEDKDSSSGANSVADTSVGGEPQELGNSLSDSGGGTASVGKLPKTGDVLFDEVVALSVMVGVFIALLACLVVSRRRSRK